MSDSEKLKALLKLVLDTAPEEIDCEQVLDVLCQYVELRQSQPLRAQSAEEFQCLRQHLSVCHECVEELEALERLFGAD